LNKQELALFPWHETDQHAEINDITRDIRAGHFWSWFGAFVFTGVLLVPIGYAVG